jgi:hypothetical protein
MRRASEHRQPRRLTGLLLCAKSRSGKRPLGPLDPRVHDEHEDEDNERNRDDHTK